MRILKFKYLFSFFLFLQFSFTKSNDFALVYSSGFKDLIVKTAIDLDSKKKGLMGLKKLKNYNGILFIYDTPKKVNIWMYNTYIPLDIIFVDKNKVITSIKKGIPLSKKILSSDSGSIAVLEIPSGCAKKLKIRKGDMLNWSLKKSSQIENNGYFHCLN